MTHNHSGYLFDSNIVIAILDNDHAAVNLVRQAQEDQRRIHMTHHVNSVAYVSLFFISWECSNNHKGIKWLVQACKGFKGMLNVELFGENKVVD